ncbi:hypothetical protein B1813_10655 [Saccharomonospora piscinae]|uniref:VOC domain-containing protein n=1 Tax=Saccharomonospora piscinae TaxID=687388 RepID=A0A1V9A662_SACPI|nr:VOC family protein [Saccharomonospora piscinae]OQO92619.1 hypothetical protein B1813_10655 [Saccharomonospora piscinae]
MPVRLRQVALIAHELVPVVDDLRSLFGLEVVFTAQDEIALRGPGLIDEFGITNAVLPVGDTFLEVISPQRDDSPAARFLDSRGERGYMLLLQCTDLHQVRQRLAPTGVRAVWESPLPDIAGVHLNPRDTGGTLISIEEPSDPTDWPWAGPNWRHAAPSAVTSAISGVEVGAVDPWSTAHVWGALLARPVSTRGDGTPQLDLDDGWIGFGTANHRHDIGIREVVLRCGDPAEVLRRAGEKGLPAVDGAVQFAGTSLRPWPDDTQQSRR